MQIFNIPINNSLQETTIHGSSEFPLAIYTDDFSLFKEGYIKWHWHSEIQFSYVLNEKISVFIQGEEIVLEPNEGIFINSNVLHQIKPYGRNNPEMFSIVFDSSIIGGGHGSVFEKKFISPILSNSNFKFMPLKAFFDWENELLSSLKKIFDSSKDKEFGYELQIKSLLCESWLNLLRNSGDILHDSKNKDSHDDDRVKRALNYIHENYAEDINLGDIAFHSNISKSECCRCFNRILRTSPFEYLIKYRILKASELLIKEKESVSTIASLTGFNSSSYFAKMFKRYMNSSPSKYRKTYKSHK